MDAFFASVEERDHPWMRGMPIVIGADPKDGTGRGVVSTANYLARTYGIHSAMPIGTAWRLAEAAKKSGAPTTLFIEPNMHRYGDASERIMKIIKKHTDMVEQAGVDEAYADLSSAGSYTKARVRAEKIQKEIKSTEHLTASVGIGSNKLIAKIASDRKKPAGLTVVTPAEVLEFLAPLPVRLLPGVGPKTESALKRMRVQTVLDLRAREHGELIKQFGKFGGDLYDKARGIDESPLEEPQEAKSVGEQETFSEDTAHPEIILAKLADLATDVMKRMKREGFATFRTVAVTVRFADFETVSRAHTLKSPAGAPDALVHEAMKLVLPFFDKRENPAGKKVRLIGLRVEKLAQQLTL